MVFTIQHTQSREQAATQLKLDELIRALPGADDHLVHVEAGADAELADIEQRHLEHHRAVRSDDREPAAQSTSGREGGIRTRGLSVPNAAR